MLSQVFRNDGYIYRVFMTMILQPGPQSEDCPVLQWMINIQPSICVRKLGMSEMGSSASDWTMEVEFTTGLSKKSVIQAAMSHVTMRMSGNVEDRNNVLGKIVWMLYNNWSTTTTSFHTATRIGQSTIINHPQKNRKRDPNHM